ncbi:hypothetical protein LX64_01166 [Chitinophaga skermanii]|uniref:Uncharacterized protein n=1 Tax=Chitinophaga skermanii TaxID=331697 RepID=A0A327QYL5_9BACT|nr:hypothetical protein LX64_01166 [Chitinophaga skermanii]
MLTKQALWRGIICYPNSHHIAFTRNVQIGLTFRFNSKKPGKSAGYLVIFLELLGIKLTTGDKYNSEQPGIFTANSSMLRYE